MGTISTIVVMGLLLLLLLAPSVVFSLQCFSTKQGATVETDVCIFELNLFNLGCLPAPARLGLFDVETAYAAGVTNVTANKTRSCEQDEHYVICYCDWDNCNRDWNELRKQKMDFRLKPKMIDCVKKQCHSGDDCYSMGTKEAKEFNHDVWRQKSTVVSKSKKERRAKIVLLWLSGVTFFFSVLGVFIYACVDDLKKKKKQLTLRECASVAVVETTATVSTSSTTQQPPSKKTQ